MKKRKKLSPIIIFISIILLLSIILLCLKISGKRFNTSKIEDTKEVETQFPYNVELDNYKIQINKPKLFNEYVLFDYNVETKDGSPIEDDDIHFTGGVKFPNKAYFVSPQNVLTEINNNKMHIVDVGIIVARENYDLYVKNPDFIISAGSKSDYEEKRIETKGVIYPARENYKEINKKIKLDDIEFNILSSGNFDFGSLITILVENTNEETAKNIMNQYAVVVKSGDYNKQFNLDDWMGFYEQAIKQYSKIDKKYNENSQYDKFYMAKLLYNPNEVNKNNMEIYLVNKNTNEEVKIN